MAETKHVKAALVGEVVSTKMDKTIIVRVDRQMKHPRYGKYVRKSKRYMVHDERSEAGEGDKVEIIECRPLSKTKSWRLKSVIAKAHAGLGEEVE